MWYTYKNVMHFLMLGLGMLVINWVNIKSIDLVDYLISGHFLKNQILQHIGWMTTIEVELKSLSVYISKQSHIKCILHPKPDSVWTISIPHSGGATIFNSVSIFGCA